MLSEGRNKRHGRLPFGNRTRVVRKSRGQDHSGRLLASRRGVVTTASMLTPGKGFDRVTPPGWWSTGPSTRHEVETAWGVRAEPHKAVESGNPERQTSLVPNPPRLSASCECEQVTLEIVSAHGAGGRARGRVPSSVTISVSVCPRTKSFGGRFKVSRRPPAVHLAMCVPRSWQNSGSKPGKSGRETPRGRYSGTSGVFSSITGWIRNTETLQWHRRLSETSSA